MNTTSSSDPAFAFCIPAAPGTRFDIGACYNRTQGCSFFPNVPIDKCYKFCGDSFGYYDLPDVFGALTTWVIPLFSLLANMHFTDSTLEGLKWPCVSRILNHRLLKPFWSVIKPQLPKHFVCSVQLANPIGTIWSLAAKLHLGQQLWNHCKKCGLPLDAEGRKDITNLCYYLDDFGHELFEDRVNRLIQLLNNGTRLRKSAMVSQIAYRYVKETSRSLAFARVRNTRHTIFAVLVYIGMAISSLLTFTTSNGLDYSLPHTIALRELCFFILAQVILSSAVGAWSQQGAPQAITRKFALRIYEIETNLRDGQPGLWKHLASKEIALWDGGSYVFRPQKRKKSRARSVGEFSCENLNLGLLGVSCFIVIFAFVASFIISYSTPTKGIGGRGLAEILYIAIWILNFFIELWMTREIRGDDEHHRKQIFICTWLKDGIISLFGLLFFFLPFMGWYNSCKSWSAWFSLFGNAYLDLSIAATESWLAYRVYLLCVILGFLVPVISASSIIYMNRDVISLSHRSNNDSMTELFELSAGNRYLPEESYEAPRTSPTEETELDDLIPDPKPERRHEAC